MPVFSALEVNSTLHQRLRRAKDYILLPIATGLHKLGVTPTMVTIFGLIAGFSSVGFLFINYWLFVIIVTISTLADGIDGTLARLTQKASKGGQLLDYYTDALVMVTMFTGLMIWLQQPAWILGLGMYGLVFVTNISFKQPIKLAPGRMYIFVPVLLGFPVIGLALITLYSIVMGGVLLVRSLKKS